MIQTMKIKQLMHQEYTQAKTQRGETLKTVVENWEMVVNGSTLFKNVKQYPHLVPPLVLMEQRYQFKWLLWGIHSNVLQL